MNAEIKAKWVAALRSGKYQQARGRLRVFDSFCCLGVLCDVSDPTKWDPPIDPDRDPYHYTPYAGMRSYLPSNLEKIVGVNTANDLAKMNDVGMSFDEIAQHIETYL